MMQSINFRTRLLMAMELKRLLKLGEPSLSEAKRRNFVTQAGTGKLWMMMMMIIIESSSDNLPNPSNQRRN